MVEEFDINKLIEEEADMMDSSEGDDREQRPERKVRKRGEGRNIELVAEGRGELLDFMLSSLKDKSRTTVKSFLRNRQVTVNQIPTTKHDQLLKAGDIVVINLGMAEKQFRNPMLRIVYEDDYIIIIDKKYGLLSMATDRERIKTAYYIISEYLKSKDRNGRVFIVHRLDRETSGLLLFAKSMEIQHQLQHNWNENILERKYVAVVEGIPAQDEGVIESYLAENKAYNVYVTKNPEEGELAITKYRVMKSGRDNALMELELETGKKNQIRVHMQQLGHSIIGDRKYGGSPSPIGRLALHAYRMRFLHPITGVEMEFDTGVPPMFLTALTLKRRRY